MEAEAGSVNHYRAYSGGFVNKMLDAIQVSDEFNRARLRLAFPQLVDALAVRDWDYAPAAYAGKQEYNARPPDVERVMHECQNCGERYTFEQLDELEELLAARVGPGEVVPSGECPRCGALCHATSELSLS